jgi:hypothetical protein
MAFDFSCENVLARPTQTEFNCTHFAISIPEVRYQASFVRRWKRAGQPNGPSSTLTV